MQRALRKKLQETTVNGKPLAGELFTEIDKDGSIREAVWDKIVEVTHSLRQCLPALDGATMSRTTSTRDAQRRGMKWRGVSWGHIGIESKWYALALRLRVSRY